VKVSGHETIPVTGWEGDEPSGDVDAQEWWFRAPLPPLEPEEGDEVVLCFDGLATICDVLVDGELVLESPSMFLRHEIPFRGGSELAIRCRPLPKGPKEPRARWRTRIADGNLRWIRTTLIGRTSFAPGPPPVGPWRPVRIERRRGVAIDEVRLRPRVEFDDGVLAVRAALRSLGPELPELEVEVGDAKASLADGEVRIPHAERWWPHTHGEPVRYPVRIVGEGVEIDAGRIGFRELTWDDGFQVNGVDVFARGAVWTHGDRQTLEQARDAGMNMLRLPGWGWYETDEFWDACDELGLLVWQDFMFANFDYPAADQAFRVLVEAEARQVLGGIAGRPSLAMLCGNSEVDQQVAMLGLEPELAWNELFDELLPGLVREAEANVPYIPTSPCDGDLPFRTNRGVAHYYGVGAYRRPLSDARLAEVRFAAECLAFSNPGDEEGFVPREAGADWDYADVSRHYEPATTGETMAEVFGEWRREASPCRGALVMCLRDLVPGAGWGVLDHAGDPKDAYHHLCRALAPVAVWTTDEGLNGIDVHVANDRPVPLRARLRVELYRDDELKVEEASEELDLPPHSSVTHNVEALLGRFVDASYAYRFGPPGHHVVVASLESDDRLISQARRRLDVS
jgi:beta-mannosidase